MKLENPRVSADGMAIIEAVLNWAVDDLHYPPESAQLLRSRYIDAVRRQSELRRALLPTADVAPQALPPHSSAEPTPG